MGFEFEIRNIFGENGGGGGPSGLPICQLLSVTVATILGELGVFFFFRKEKKPITKKYTTFRFVQKLISNAYN
mgnify:CR=1 FL=1